MVSGYGWRAGVNVSAEEMQMEVYFMDGMSFAAPKSLEEALDVLKSNANSVVLAGGTDLTPRLNARSIKPEHIVYIGNLGLSYIKLEDHLVKIGASTTFTSLLASDVIKEKAPVLVEAIQQIGSVAIRNAGTIGGNLANGSPAADSVPALIVLDAKLCLKGASGERVVKVEEFFKGPGETALEPGEILTEISFPPFVGQAVFLKMGRRKAETLSVVNCAAGAIVRDGTCQQVRVAMGAVAPTVIHAKKAESILEGKKATRELVAGAVDALMAEVKPVDDQRATAWYRMKAARVLATRALEQVLGL